MMISLQISWNMVSWRRPTCVWDITVLTFCICVCVFCVCVFWGCVFVCLCDWEITVLSFWSQWQFWHSSFSQQWHLRLVGNAIDSQDLKQRSALKQTSKQQNAKSVQVFPPLQDQVSVYGSGQIEPWVVGPDNWAPGPNLPRTLLTSVWVYVYNQINQQTHKSQKNAQTRYQIYQLNR